MVALGRLLLRLENSREYKEQGITNNSDAIESKRNEGRKTWRYTSADSVSQLVINQYVPKLNTYAAVQESEASDKRRSNATRADRNTEQRKLDVSSLV